MKFFLDENFPRSARELLEGCGYEVWEVRGTPQEGRPDTEVFAAAQDKQAVFLTTDRDFFHTVPHVYDAHFGVVVIALRQPNRKNLLSRLSWFLGHFGDEDISGRVFELRDTTYVTYPARRS